VKYLGHSIRGKRDYKRHRYIGHATVTLHGRIFFTRRTVTLSRVVFADGLTRRQVVKAAAKKSGYHWNIPFFV